MRNIHHKVDYVYWSAAILKKRISYPEALQIANKFSWEELRRIYMSLKARKS